MVLMKIFRLIKTREDGGTSEAPNKTRWVGNTMADKIQYG